MVLISCRLAIDPICFLPRFGYYPDRDGIVAQSIEDNDYLGSMQSLKFFASVSFRHTEYPGVQISRDTIVRIMRSPVLPVSRRPYYLSILLTHCRFGVALRVFTLQYATPLAARWIGGDSGTAGGWRV
jgi:hypothetical protein